MAAALPFIAIGFQVFSALSSARAARKEAEYNAAINERNAGIARDQAAADAEAQGRHARMVIGRARAGYGASGVTQEGSPIDVLAMSAANAELDRQNILYRGELRAMGYQDTAALDRSRASAATQRGLEGAASSILTGGSKIYASRPQRGYQLGDYADYSSIDMGV
jgi:hypothetical protein